jgi:hypothetical protein
VSIGLFLENEAAEEKPGFIFVLWLDPLPQGSVIVGVHVFAFVF